MSITRINPEYQAKGSYAEAWQNNGMSSAALSLNSGSSPYIRWTESDGTLHQIVFRDTHIQHERYESNAWVAVATYLNSSRSVLVKDDGWTSVAGNGSYVQVAQLNIPEAGVYELNYGGAFEANNTGYRAVYLSTMGAGRYSPAIQAATTEQTRFGASHVYKFTAATTITLYAKQNSGTSLAFYPYIRAVRIA